VALLVLIPLVLNTGPFPDVFGVGRLTPFSRMQATNFVSAVLDAALLKRAPPVKLPAPHFLSASWYCVRLTPFGSWSPPAPPGGPACPVVPVPAGGRFADGVGSVMPCFCRQDLNAANWLDLGACALFDDALELVFAVLVELLPELPHAASVQQAPRTESAKTGRMRRLVVG
jgi:hypothetical protein